MNAVEKIENESALRLDREGLHEYQRNRFPYLLVDIAEEVIPGKSAKGYKNLSTNEWFFECHFPGDPNMPGMLQVEAMVQLAALTVLTLPGNKGKVAYLVSLTNIRLRRKIVPGDRLQMETVLHSWARGMAKCSGKGYVDGQVACEAEFTLVLPDLLRNFQVASKDA